MTVVDVFEKLFARVDDSCKASYHLDWGWD